jgi:hypothetical protein
MLPNVITPPRNDAELDALTKHLNHVNKNHINISLSAKKSNKLRDYACALAGFKGGYQALLSHWEKEKIYPFNKEFASLGLLNRKRGIVAIFCAAIITDVVRSLTHSKVKLFNANTHVKDDEWGSSSLNSAYGKNQTKSAIESGFPIIVGGIKIGFAFTEEDAICLNALLSHATLMQEALRQHSLKGRELATSPIDQLTEKDRFSRYVHHHLIGDVFKKDNRAYLVLSPSDKNTDSIYDDVLELSELMPLKSSVWIFTDDMLIMPFDTLELKTDSMTLQDGNKILHFEHAHPMGAEPGIPEIKYGQHCFSGVVGVVGSSKEVTIRAGEEDEDGERHLLKEKPFHSDVVFWESGYEHPTGKIHIYRKRASSLFFDFNVQDDAPSSWIHDDSRDDQEIEPFFICSNETQGNSLPPRPERGQVNCFDEKEDDSIFDDQDDKIKLAMEINNEIGFSEIEMKKETDDILFSELFDEVDVEDKPGSQNVGK